MTLQNVTIASCVLVLQLFWAQPETVVGQDVEIRLNDGTIRRGLPDRSTNQSQLRLRVGEPDAYIVYSLDWADVTEVRDEDQVWSAERFSEYRAYLAKRFADAAPESTARSQESNQVVLPLIPSARPLWQPPVSPASSEPSDDRVRFIEIDVVPANWNRATPWDGIVLRVWPMNQRGEVVRVPGTVSVMLFGERGQFARRHEQLGYWVRAVRPGDFGPDGFSVRLEYQASHPERWDAAGHADHWIEPYGEVHVRLAIPGHGVFRASTDRPVRLRRFSGLRDRRFTGSGTRFFLPSED